MLQLIQILEATMKKSKAITNLQDEVNENSAGIRVLKKHRINYSRKLHGAEGNMKRKRIFCFLTVLVLLIVQFDIQEYNDFLSKLI